MKKYLALYKSSMSAREMMASMAPEAGQAEMAKWMSWGASAGASLLDWGSPLGEATTIGTAGPSGHVTGYSIVSADDMAGARRLFDAHPHLGAPDASIEVIEMLPLPGQS